MHGVPEAASEKHVPFGDSTKHLCSSAAQMFARCVILSTNKPRGKKKKKSLEGFCTVSWDHVSSLIATTRLEFHVVSLQLLLMQTGVTRTQKGAQKAPK